MRGRVVIGANFGDEGKGLMVDYLCAYEGAGAVVRFNGGAQSGHTVVTPDGRRHVFHHFGAGAFSGVPTYLSQFFALNPILFFRELDELSRLGLNPVVFAHPSCLVTTFADMMINQRRENERGDKRHGSVGIGFHETLTRSKVSELKITMSDLWNGVRLESRIDEICDRWSKYRCGVKLDEPAMAERFLKGCAIFAEAVHPAGIQQCKDPVFEGGQGLLLDQHNKEFFPHVTHSSTGMKNVRELAAQAKLTDLDIYYMSRSYLTRHGAGPLPGENSGMKFEDDTNVDHPYQGTLRFAPLDGSALHKRIRADAESSPYKLVLTHCDQLAPSTEADLLSYGSTREDVRTSDARKRLLA